MERIRAESVKSDDGEGGGNFELWTEETVDIETPFSNLAQDDIEYLKLEIAELKQILIALAEKYKLSEDKRKVAERRNSFLKADNLRLQQMSDKSLSQKIEAEIESRRTLDKLREFIDFKLEFEKQAELLKKIISHLPRLKNAATSTRYEMVEKSEQCSGDGYILTEHDLTMRYNDPYYRQSDAELYQALDVESTCGSYKPEDCKNDNGVTASPDMTDGYYEPIDSLLTNDKPFSDPDSTTNKENNMNNINHNGVTTEELSLTPKLCNNEEFQNETDMRTWDPKTKKDSLSVPAITCTDLKVTKSKIKLSKLKQEVLALKNLNEWKSSDLDYKNRQLAVKNRELLHAKKEITQLKMRVNKLLIEQQKRPSTSCISMLPTKLDTRNKPEKVNRIHVKESSKIMICQSKTGIASDEAINKRKAVASETNVRSEMNKLACSSEKVWQEIAPGDFVRIKMTKQQLD